MSTGELIVVGLSHHTAPVEVRERIAVAPEGLPAELRAFLASAGTREGLVISTCNRVELYAAARDVSRAAEAAHAYLHARAGDTVASYAYERRGRDAIQHAFRVASSLDSMVVGEAQILGQVKHAYCVAEAAGTTGMLLGRCFTTAFGVAKRVRTETRIAEGTVSVSSVAVELARKIFDDLSGRTVLIVGAGKMSETAAKALRKLGARLVVVNRSPERAAELAKAYVGTPRPWESLPAELAAVDVVVSSTASPGFVITAAMAKAAVHARKRRPLFLIDIAIPRDIEPAAGELENVFLYDLDDLQKVAHSNLDERKKEVAAAETIVEGEVACFEAWRKSLDLTPTIVALRERFADTARQELERTLPRLKELSPDSRKTLGAMCDAIVNKLLHTPLTELKREAVETSGAELIDATRRLFQLVGSSSTPPPAPSEAPAAEPTETAKDSLPMKDAEGRAP